MWRWWILAGLAVMGLGVMACRDAGRLEENPCAHEDPDDDLWGGGVPIEGDLRLHYVARVDVDFGKTARLVLSLRNPQPYVQAIVRNDNMDFVVTTPECELVWWSRDITPRAVSGTVQLRFDSKEEKSFAAEWGLTDSWGEMVSPGDYLVHARMNMLGRFLERFPSPTRRHELRVVLVGFERVRIEEGQLRSGQPARTPAPWDPSASCGEPADEARILRALHEHRQIFWGYGYEATSAYMLDENRMPTETRGIRVVAPRPPLDLDEVMEAIPDCLEGVPVQLVVMPDS